MKRVLATITSIPLLIIFIYGGFNLLISLVANFFSGWGDVFSIVPLPLTTFSTAYFVDFLWFLVTAGGYAGLRFCWEHIKYDK
jgi:hypothetical protein